MSPRCKRTFGPWLAEQDESLVYAGKYQRPDTHRPGYARYFWELRRGLDRHSDMFDPVIDRALTDIYREAIKPIQSAGKRFVFLEEAIISAGGYKRFHRNLTMFNRIGFEGRYLLRGVLALSRHPDRDPAEP